MWCIIGIGLGLVGGRLFIIGVLVDHSGIVGMRRALKGS